MFKTSLTMFLVFAFSLGYSYDKVYVLSKEAFEDFKISSNGIVINNYSVSEDSAWAARGLNNINVSLSAKNKNKSAAHFAVMISGKDRKGNTLWTMHLEPMMSTISGNETESLKSSVYCAKGDLDLTEKIWVRIIGDF
ncbi:MAG: hypothetical protein A2Y41_04775 [Spirochaetes bacterium GWB1_36_13]|nr:MAG: hypothetical protein A2Y41_04775 [Spirochaetes bacterium GWB1_36_13]